MCGKSRGPSMAGQMCDACGVLVVVDAHAERRRRLGHVRLACPCLHPLDSDLHVSAFPILPVGYRTDGKGTPNALGRKFEALIRENESPHEAPDYYPTMVRLDRTKLQMALDDVTGARRGPTLDATTVSVGSLVHAALADPNPNLDTLVRSWGCGLSVNAHL